MQNEQKILAKRVEVRVEIKKAVVSGDCAGMPHLREEKQGLTEEELKKLVKERNTPQPLGPGLGCVR